MHWREQFDAIHARMLDYDASIESMDDDDDDDGEGRQPEMSLDVLLSILQDACNLLRQADEERLDDFDVVLEQVNGLLNRAIAERLALGELDGGTTGLRSFAHAPGGLVEDPWNDRMRLESQADVFRSLATIFGLGGTRVNEYIEETSNPLTPWSKKKQPHVQTTPLSRFRDAIEFPTPSTHPHASVVFQARCEINNDSVNEPEKLVLSSDGSYMAMPTSGGYRGRDPIVSYWDTGKDSDDFEHKSFSPPLAHHIVDLVLDEPRRLLFIADFDRIKSYTYGTQRKPVHTMKSDAFSTGPLAILPNARLLRGSKGSALVWNIDELETHYAPDSTEYRRIGEGKYDGFEHGWRDEDCKKELSTGSLPHNTVPFAESELIPHVWQYHAPSGHMLVGEDPKDSQKCECLALDLEHGGKIVTRYIGHGDQVESFSISDGDPNVFLTASADGYARLYDVRKHLPVLTMSAEMGEMPCESAILVHLDGLPAVFTGGTSSQGIRFWDVRAKKLVYELSTGNNAVRSLAWDQQRSTLYATTYPEHRGGMDGRGVYRKAKKVKRSSEDVSAMDGDDDMEDDDDDTDEDIDENSVEFYDTLRWPKSAYHQEDYFGGIYDAGGKLIFRYAFKEDVNTDLIPPYGSGTLGGAFF